LQAKATGKIEKIWENRTKTETKNETGKRANTKTENKEKHKLWQHLKKIRSCF